MGLFACVRMSPACAWHAVCRRTDSPLCSSAWVVLFIAQHEHAIMLLHAVPVNAHEWTHAYHTACIVSMAFVNNVIV